MRLILFLISLAVSLTFAGLANGSEVEQLFESVNRLDQKHINDHSYILPMGRIKKDRVTGRDLPDKYQKLRGDFSSTVWELKGDITRLEAKNTVAEFVQSPIYEMVFQCYGRDCGESFAWANAMFNQPTLYGSDRTQTLWVVKHKTLNQYQLYYLIERPNRRLYLYREILTPGGGSKGNISLAQTLKLEGRVILINLDPDNWKAGMDELVNRLEGMTDPLDAGQVLVAHRHGAKGTALDKDRLLEAMGQALAASGHNGLEMYDVGNLAPNMAAETCCWIELVNTNWKPVSIRGND